MDGLKQWALTLITGGLAAGIAVAITPKGGAAKTLKMVAAVFIILVMISPLVNRDITDGFLPAFNEYTVESNEEENMKEYMVSVCREQIKNEIENTAKEMGTNIESAEIEIYIDNEYCINIQTVTVVSNSPDAGKIRSELSEKLGVPVRIISL